MRFREHALSHRLLDGLSGLEIGGAAHNPFGLDARNVAPVEGFEASALVQEGMGERPAPVDLWGFADAIPVPDGSQGFVVSSHVVQHLPDLASAFLEWDRVVRAGGIVLMIAPRRDALEQDAERPVTTLDHFLEDLRVRKTLDTHALDGVPGGRMGHYHVLTPESVLELVSWLNRAGAIRWETAAREDVDGKVGNGFCLAFRVLAGSRAPREALVLPPVPTPAARPQFALPAAVAPLLSRPSAGRAGGGDSRTLTVGLFGTFEVDNFGDVLFPALFSHGMAGERPRLETVLFGPAAGVCRFDGRPVQAVGALRDYAEGLDAFVVGGGDLLRFDAPVPPDPRPGALPPCLELFLAPAFHAAVTGKPLAWNAPGIPFPLERAQRDVVAGILSVSDYVSVRDAVSRRHLGDLRPELDVVPDSGFLVADAYPKECLVPVARDLRERLQLPPRYLAAFLSPATSRAEDGPAAAEALRIAGEKLGLPVLLLPLGPFHGDAAALERLADASPAVLRCLAPGLLPLELAALIAHAEAFVGGGFHGNVAAFAYGVPSVPVNTLSLAKVDELCELTGRPGLARWEELPARLPDLERGSRAADEEARRARIRERLATHFRHLSDALARPRPAAGNAAEALLDVVRGLAANEGRLPRSLRPEESAALLNRQLLALAASGRRRFRWPRLF